MPQLNEVILATSIAKVRGGYAVTVLVGADRSPVHLILDSGSSTLAIHGTAYAPEADPAVKSTTFAQDVTYGAGGWAGPVLHTTIDFCDGPHEILMENAPLAYIVEEMEHTFEGADGVFGLAYHILNKAYDLGTHLEQENIEPAATFPWPFAIANTGEEIRSFKKFLRSHPEQDITPCFTEMEEEGLCGNQFGFAAHRAVVHVASHDPTPEQLEQDPLNRGALVLGGGKDVTSLYQGEFSSIEVVHDAYYNVRLTQVAVAGFEPVAVPPIDEKHLDTYFSNAIIDTGSSFLVMENSVYDYLLDCLGKIDASFPELISQGTEAAMKQSGIPNELLELDRWPTLEFIFEGPGGTQTMLSCPARQYWQTNALAFGQSFLTLMRQLPKWPRQSILGLPLISNYYCVFDRDFDAAGAIHFAAHASEPASK